MQVIISKVTPLALSRHVKYSFVISLSAAEVGPVLTKYTSPIAISLAICSCRNRWLAKPVCLVADMLGTSVFRVMDDDNQDLGRTPYYRFLIARNHREDTRLAATPGWSACPGNAAAAARQELHSG
jgi:hypothetical protein